MNWFPDYNYILASRSPRRLHLLQSIGLEFEVRVKEIAETYPEALRCDEIPEYLAKLKAVPFRADLKEKDLLITADTVVILKNEVMGKPANEAEAKAMLARLSGNEHQVITGVALTSRTKQKVFHAVTNVQFKKLKRSEISYYVTQFRPFDKAGAYGIQEWIGFIGITHIEGSFHNVMGLPVQRLYQELLSY